MLKKKLFILLSKSRRLCLMILAIPFIFFVRLLRPLIVIRFGCLDSRRIGHFIAMTKGYLCERNAGMHSPRTFDIFYHYPPISNLQVKRMWERTGKLHIAPFTSFTKTLDRLNRLLPGGEKHVIPLGVRDIYALGERTKAYLSFTPEEEDFGRKELQKLGVSDGVSFVCFHARDPAYLDKVFPNRNWSWDYLNYRNSSIHNYVLAAQELVQRGYFAIRMGAVVKEPLHIQDGRIIDYAVKGRTDFMDIYLAAKCRFFIGSAVGILEVPEAFRQPIVWVNFIPLEWVHTWGRNQIFIPKKLWLRKEHRFLTFREILNSGIGRFVDARKYDALEIEIIENTPQEIADVAMEMDERLKGKWQRSDEDEQLQRRFWALFKPNELNQIFVSRIGAEFLRQNRELLE